MLLKEDVSETAQYNRLPRCVSLPPADGTRFLDAEHRPWSRCADSERAERLASKCSAIRSFDMPCSMARSIARRGIWRHPPSQAALRRSFVRLVKQTGVPPIRFHDLSHTHATLLLKVGTHAKIGSERLGQANIGSTLDTYSHILPSLHREAAESIDKALFGSAGE